MKMLFMSRKSFISCFIFLLTILSASPLFSDNLSENKRPAANFSINSKTVTENKNTDNNIDYDKEQIKKLEEKEDRTENAIEEKKEDIQEAKEKAEKAIAQKEALEQEAALKGQAAAAAKEEYERAKKEAKITKDKATQEKAKKLAAEAEKLEKEAEISRRKLSVAESKAKAVEESISANEAKIAALTQALNNIKKEKSARRSFLEKTFTSLAIILIGLFSFMVMKLALKKFESVILKKENIDKREVILRAQTISKLFNWLGGIIIVGVILYMVLENHGINVAPILAGLGIASLAFGFGGQYLIRDLINGLFILLEDQFRVNDVIKIGDHGGLVENVNLRITTLRDLEGRIIIIPNGEISTVINFTKEYSHALFDIGVAYKENVDKVMDVIKQIGAEMRKDQYFGRLILADLEMFGVDDFGDSQVTIKFRIKTRPIKQWEVSREFKRRLKNRFDELGIEIPFPHRTMYWGTGQDNDWMRMFAEKASSK